MKIGEALIARKHALNSIALLKDRYVSAAVHQKDEEPEDVARDIFSQFENNLEESRRLTVALNHANNVTKVTTSVGQMTVMEAVIYRDMLKLKHGMVLQMINALRSRNRYNPEQKEVLAEGISVRDLTKVSDDVGKEIRLLDIAMQEVNWTADLIEQ
jgi:hypothetical protein